MSSVQVHRYLTCRAVGRSENPGGRGGTPTHILADQFTQSQLEWGARTTTSPSQIFKPAAIPAIMGWNYFWTTFPYKGILRICFNIFCTNIAYAIPQWIFCKHAFKKKKWLKCKIQNSSENKYPHCVIRTCDLRSKRERASTELTWIN